MQSITQEIFRAFIGQNASDLYLTVGAPPCIRLHGKMTYYSKTPLSEENVNQIMQDILPEKAIAEFEATFEYNTAINWEEKIRLRVNVFKQKQYPGLVIRRVHTEIPTLQSLSLPSLYGELMMEKHGLILVVGPTGSGKSSSLAAMVGYRNSHGGGHIITVEDPIEFEHNHQNCIITQRDVGIDTVSFNAALKNALRQMPDVIVIGEIRDLDTMQSAINFAETGHLCVATLHASNTNQAIERIMHLFPEDQRTQMLMSLSMNLKAVLSQRLVRNIQNTRSIAVEIMLNSGHIRELIIEGNIKTIREHVERGGSSGMQTFEQALLKLYEDNVITEEVALSEADSPANLRLAMRKNKIGMFGDISDPLRPPDSAAKLQF